MNLKLTYFLFLLFLSPVVLRAQVPEQDCINAIPVCQSFYSQTNSYVGTGAYATELTSINQGCLGSGEKNDVWYVINVTTSGLLSFTITPVNLSNDYDFAVWDISGVGCSAIFNYNTNTANPYPPVACNYSGTPGATGLSTTITGSQWSPSIAVTAGQTLVLNVSNFSSTAQGYSLDFGPSTASIFDTVKPKFLSVTTQCQFTSSQLIVKMTEPVKCNSITPTATDFYITPATGTSIITANGVNCGTTVNSATSTILLGLSSVLTPGTYWLHAQTGSDANTLLDNCGNAQSLGDSIQFTLVPANPPQLTYVDTPACIKARVHFDRPIKCASVAANGSDFTISGPGAVGIKKAAPIGCSAKGITDTVDVYFNASIVTPGTYTLGIKTGTDNNAITDTCQLSVDNTISFVVSDEGYVYATATPSVLCAPGYVALNSVVTIPPPPSTVSCGVNGTPCGSAPTSYAVGSTTATGSGTYTPFYGFYMDGRTQLLFRANELTAAGLGNGTITNLAFNITQKLSSAPYNNFTIKMGCTSSNQLTDYISGLPIVYNPKPYTTVLGTNTFPFDNTFDWDGTSNVVVEICYHNTAYTQSDAVQTTTGLGAGSTFHYHQDLGQGCALAGTFATAANTRPNVTFTECTPPPSAHVYLWSPSTLIGDTTAQNTIAFVSQTATYQMQIMDSSFCYRRSRATVTVSVRNPALLTDDTAVCLGLSTTLRATGGATYHWYPAEGLSCTDCSDPVATPLQTTTYYVSIADQYGCADTLKETVTVNALPIVDAGRDTTIVYGTELQLYANVRGGYYYMWDPPTWLSNAIAPNPIATPQVSTTYTVYVSDTNQCKAQDSIRVNVLTDVPVFVPSGFTPNGDGRNDIFKVANLTFQKVIEFRVLNRWGEEIFHAQDNRGWDGKYKGTLQQGGVYQYLVRVAYPDGHVEKFHGDVTLIR